MNNPTPPHTVLSKLEKSKCDRLLADLEALMAEHNRLVTDLEATMARCKEIRRRRHKHLHQRIKAVELAALEAAYHEEATRKSEIISRLSTLSDKEKKLKAAVLASMNKSKAYAHLQQKEEDEQKRLSSHADQQATDDLMAHRCMKGGLEQ